VVNATLSRARYAGVDRMNFEAPLTSLVWLTSMVSVAVTYVASYLLVRISATAASGGSSRRSSAAGTLAGHHPRVRQDLTSTDSAHVREVVASAREGGRHSTSSRVRRRELQRLLARRRHRDPHGDRYGVSTLGLGR